MKTWPWFVLSLLIIIGDQLSKYWVSAHLLPYEPMSILPILNVTLAYNTGAAFSFLDTAGAWHRWFFAGLSLCISLILVVWLWRTPNSPRIHSLGISCILGGALGNLIDRALHGYVLDFIDFYYGVHHFATFNLADAAICIGALSLALDLMINNHSVKEKSSSS
jgi:signal peptidase II